jgi:OPA family glycerol-3-phosphate transporter-like MFS transporter
MIEEGVIDVGVAAVLSAVYFGCYAVGQLLNGAAADKHSPFVLVSIGLVSIAITNASMMLPLSPYVRIVVWGLNGLAQSMLWCPIFYIISNVLHSRVRYFAITIITLTTPLGKASCAWLSGVAIGFGRWQYIFLMASSVILLSGVLWISFCLTRRKDFVVDRTPTVPAEDEKKGNGLFGLLFKSGVVFMLPAMLVYGLFLNGVVELVPSILVKEYGLSSTGRRGLIRLSPS